MDKRLAEKAGYKDAKDYFSKQLADLSQSTLTQYGAVAEAFTEPVARRFGVTCLYLLLSYKEAADVDVNPEEPGDTLIEVPDEKGHVTHQAVRAVQRGGDAPGAARKRKPSSSKPLPPEAETRAEQYARRGGGPFPKGKGTRVKVLLRNEKGKAVLDFKGIPGTRSGSWWRRSRASSPPTRRRRRSPSTSELSVRGGPAFLKRGDAGPSRF